MFELLFGKKSPTQSKMSRARAKPQAKPKQLSGFDLWFAKIQVSGKLRMRIYEKLGRFVANGVPITQALDEIYLHMSEDGKKPTLPAAIAIDAWRRAIRNGKTFARALQGWAPSGELSVLDAGEVSGQLDKSIADVLLVYEANKKIKGALSGLIYPIVLIGVTCGYLYVFGTQVVPAFANVLPIAKWQGTGKQMAVLADFVRTWLLPIVIVICGLVATIIATFGRWTGPIRKRLDHIPPWAIYRLMAGSGFLISLSALLHAGVSVPDALRTIYATASPWYRERLSAIRQQVLNGARNIGEAMHKSGFDFPSREIMTDIRSYAGLEGFEEMLDKLSRQWLEEAIKSIEKQMDILRNIAIIIMGFTFMWIASGMFSLQQQISQSASGS